MQKKMDLVRGGKGELLRLGRVERDATTTTRGQIQRKKEKHDNFQEVHGGNREADFLKGRDKTGRGVCSDDAIQILKQEE